MRISRHPQAKPAGRCVVSTLPSLSLKFVSSTMLSGEERSSQLTQSHFKLPDIGSSTSPNRLIYCTAPKYLPSEHSCADELSPQRHANVVKLRPTVPAQLCKCGTCSGCVGDIHKNSRMMWYVMHSIVENLPGGPIDIADSARIWATMFTIVESIRCQEWRIHSNRWLSEIAPSSGNLPDQKEDWVYAVWKHHNDVTKKVRGEKKPTLSLLREPLSWGEYLLHKLQRVQVVARDLGYPGKQATVLHNNEVISLEVRY